MNCFSHLNYGNKQGYQQPPIQRQYKAQNYLYIYISALYTYLQHKKTNPQEGILRGFLEFVNKVVNN